LILDLREEVDYDLYHIVEAINYPSPNLKRDKTFPLLRKFKNA
jgi:centrosomal protein CEP41